MEKVQSASLPRFGEARTMGCNGVAQTCRARGVGASRVAAPGTSPILHHRELRRDVRSSRGVVVAKSGNRETRCGGEETTAWRRKVSITVARDHQFSLANRRPCWTRDARPDSARIWTKAHRSGGTRCVALTRRQADAMPKGVAMEFLEGRIGVGGDGDGDGGQL